MPRVQKKATSRISPRGAAFSVAPSLPPSGALLPRKASYAAVAEKPVPSPYRVLLVAEEKGEPHGPVSWLSPLAASSFLPPLRPPTRFLAASEIAAAGGVMFSAAREFANEAVSCTKKSSITYFRQTL